MSTHKRSDQSDLKALIDQHKQGDDYLSALDIQIFDGEVPAIIQAIKDKDLGKKVFFCTGSRTMRKLGFLQTYQTEFQRQGFEVAHYDDISPNPTLHNMRTGVQAAKKFNPDFVFALGGGSVIDSGKVIACSLGEHDVWDYVKDPSKIEQVLPVVAVTTTSGTGSHVTPYCVVTDTDTFEKRTLKHTDLLPKLSMVDLAILQHLPPSTIAATGFDVLAHAAEVYTRKDCSPEAAEFCRQSLKYVREHLIASYNSDSDADRRGMALADTYAGIALAMIGTHVPHAISHPISGRSPKVDHGTSLAYVLAETTKVLMEKNDPALNEKFMQVSSLLGGNSNLVRTLHNYQKLLDIETPPRFSADECEDIYLDTMGYRVGSVNRSPVPLTPREVRSIIYNSMCEDN
ncbi:iron-containing alcohol dehydrogenase [Nanoarchaeota archaeon]